MPASTTDYTKIRELQESAASKTKAGRGIVASAGTLGDNVMQAVRADRTSRGVQKLSTDVGNVMGQMVTDPTGIRERTSGIVDPLSVNRLTSAARAENLRTLGTVATQRGLTEATMQETIQAGANRLEAQAKELYAQAEEATAQAGALQDEWEMGFKERQFAADEAYRKQQVAQDWAKINADANVGTGDSEGLSINYLEGLSEEDARRALAEAVAEGDLTPTDAKYIEDALLGGGSLESQDAASLLERLEGLSEDVGKVPKVAAFLEKLPLVKQLVDTHGNQDVLNAKVNADLLGMEIARLFEKGRLSDQDREFYLSNMPSLDDIALNPKRAERKVQAVINYFEDRIGGGDGTDVTQEEIDEYLRITGREAQET